MSIVSSCAFAGAAPSVETLRKEVDALRKRLNDRAFAPITRVDAITEKHYGPDVPVSTNAGKLEISGLLQIWNYSITNDSSDVFGNREGGSTSDAIDNDGYRIRRTEITFKLDIHENITAVIMIDPSREALSSAPIPSNAGLFKSRLENPSVAAGSPVALTSVGRVQTGAGASNRMLQDAYINYHGVIPHHDVQLGQFKPHMGEEGTRSSAYLDFAERAMVTQSNDLRDLGIQVHGTYWNDRFQYWVSAFNGAGNFFGTAINAASGQTSQDFQNRSDDNDSKDFLGSFLVRPIWFDKECTWYGHMELGYSGQVGKHGEGHRENPIEAPNNGLNRADLYAHRHAAWFMYRPFGHARGLWVRGEYGYQHDRPAPLAVNALGLGGGAFGEQTSPNPINREGFYMSTGYKLSDSIFADRLSKGGFWNNLIQPVEFAFRYERFENIITEDLVAPDIRSDLFNTEVLTAGVNYYIKAYNMRVQVNYMAVNEVTNDSNEARGLREVKNNVFIFTYQVSF